MQPDPYIENKHANNRVQNKYLWRAVAKWLEDDLLSGGSNSWTACQRKWLRHKNGHQEAAEERSIGSLQLTSVAYCGARLPA